MENSSFRDFAQAIMKEDDPGAAGCLVYLLGLVPTAAAGAVIHFRKGMRREGPEFMRRATGLRKAVLSEAREEVNRLLEACFGLTGDQALVAHTNLRHLFVAHSLN